MVVVDNTAVAEDGGVVMIGVDVVVAAFVDVVSWMVAVVSGAIVVVSPGVSVVVAVVDALVVVVAVIVVSAVEKFTTGSVVIEFVDLVSIGVFVVYAGLASVVRSEVMEDVSFRVVSPVQVHTHCQCSQEKLFEYSFGNCDTVSTN